GFLASVPGRARSSCAGSCGPPLKTGLLPGFRICDLPRAIPCTRLGARRQGREVLPAVGRLLSLKFLLKPEEGYAAFMAQFLRDIGRLLVEQLLLGRRGRACPDGAIGVNSGKLAINHIHSDGLGPWAPAAGRACVALKADCFALGAGCERRHAALGPS